MKLSALPLSYGLPHRPLLALLAHPSHKANGTVPSDDDFTLPTAGMTGEAIWFDLDSA